MVSVLTNRRADPNREGLRTATRLAALLAPPSRVDRRATVRFTTFLLDLGRDKGLDLAVNTDLLRLRPPEYSSSVILWSEEDKFKK